MDSHGLSNGFKFTYLSAANADYIDEQFQLYLKDPRLTEPTFRSLFEGMELGHEFALRELADGIPAESSAAEPSIDWDMEMKAVRLIQAYREFGRVLSDIDPLHPASKSHPQLELQSFGLSTLDLSRPFLAASLIGLPARSTLEQLVNKLRSIYCGTIAFELEEVSHTPARDWLRLRIEQQALRKPLTPAEKKRIFQRLLESESLERFLGLRFVAAKRFSIEGGEALIPGIDEVIELGAELGLKEVSIGMAHRGRLNVLVNTLGKKPEYLFTEFEGNYKFDPSEGEGDVKYHKGYSRDLTTSSGKTVHLSLASNPSHLEFVNPVVTGIVRAKQELMGDRDRTQVLPILIHGDAAMAGQGVVYETLNFAGLEGYATGGTLHIAINNQVGFTTDPRDSRTTQYCTDVAKMMDAPVFHVNGDDAEAVVAVFSLALEYRQKFHADVFIDLVCYRKHGHNEGDEPSFTQPLMYKTIKAHESPREVYGKKLASTGVMPADEQTAAVDTVMARLNAALELARKEAPHPHAQTLEGRWKGLRRGTEKDILESRPKTSVDAATLKLISEKTNTLPDGFKPHAKLARFFETRLKAVVDGKGIDWGNGESLAHGSLLLEGHPVRITGQDAERGTFTHRHAVVSDFESGKKTCPLNSMKPGQASLQIHNSHLSETGVLGFEYGYSLTDPKCLTLWEAQFGDFANGAQVIIDQFIAAGESKWSRMSGLVLLLPHGYEGQGPEHSSARLERFLQLSGRGNWTICNFTTPAQLFHALRRQVKWDFRKPMVVMTPKSLLRHPMAISSLDEFTTGSFQEVLNDPQATDSAWTRKVEQVILCSGKIYYDLVVERQNLKRDATAVVRVEQLYPWPVQALEALKKAYPSARDWVWCQEEPQNMGAWWYVTQQAFARDRKLRYAGRSWSCSPAVGSPKVHEQEQKSLVAEALKG